MAPSEATSTLELPPTERDRRAPNPFTGSAGSSVPVRRYGSGSAHQRRRHRTRPRLGARNTRSRWDVQGLRALAVLVVVANHAWGWPRGGFVGVDVFFVISGFLITGLLLREWDRTGHISFSGFYRRRVKRILPASLVVLVATVGVSWFVFNQARWSDTVTDGVWALLFAANWRFALQSTNYFETDRPVSPLQHYWSLGVEEQFYLVWPWLMLLVLVLLARAGRTRPRLVVGVLVAALSVASFAWALHDSSVAANRAYFSTFTRAWELGLGALLAVAAPLASRLPERIRPVLSWLGLAGIVAGLFWVNPADGFQAPAVALPVAATALVIAAGTGVAQQRLLLPLTNRVAGYVGDISYSLYLWHFPVLVIGRAIVGGGAWDGLLLVGVALLAAVYSYHLVEDPLRRSDWLRPRRTRAARTRVPRWNAQPHQVRRRHRRRPGPEVLTPAYQRTALSLLAVVTAVLVVLAVQPLLRTTTSAAPVTLPTAGSTPSSGSGATSSAQTRLSASIAQALTATSWPTLSPSMNAVMSGGLGPADIHACGSADTIDEATCTFGDPKATHTMVVVGNSLAVVYVDLLRQVVGDTGGWKVISYGMYACGFRDMAMMPPGPDAQQSCSRRPDDAVAAINRLHPDVVVMSGTGTVAATESEIAKITVKPKLVMLPGPPADKDVNDCYSKVSTPTDCVSTPEASWGAAESQVAGDVGGVYVNSLPWFCVDGRCPAFVGTTPTKLDRFHLTSAYETLITPVARDTLTSRGVIRLGGS